MDLVLWANIKVNSAWVSNGSEQRTGSGCCYAVTYYKANCFLIHSFFQKQGVHYSPGCARCKEIWYVMTPLQLCKYILQELTQPCFLHIKDTLWPIDAVLKTEPT